MFWELSTRCQVEWLKGTYHFLVTFMWLCIWTTLLSQEKVKRKNIFREEETWSTTSIYKYLLNTTTVFPVYFKIMGILWMFPHIGKFTWRKTDIIHSSLDGFYKSPKPFKSCLGDSFGYLCIILLQNLVSQNNCFIIFHDSVGWQSSVRRFSVPQNVSRGCCHLGAQLGCNVQCLLSWLALGTGGWLGAQPGWSIIMSWFSSRWPLHGSWDHHSMVAGFQEEVFQGNKPQCVSTYEASAYILLAKSQWQKPFTWPSPECGWGPLKGMDTYSFTLRFTKVIVDHPQKLLWILREQNGSPRTVEFIGTLETLKFSIFVL